MNLSGPAQEDVTGNKFFKSLQSNHKIWNEIEKHCYIVCVPCANALETLTINTKVLEHHILKPSPLFRDIYVVYNNNDCCCEFEDQCIKTTKGYPQNRKANILSEEVMLNSSYQSYRVLCIDIPLYGGTAERKIPKKTADSRPDVKDISMCIKYLNHFPENEIVLQKLDHKLNEFQDSYVIVKGFEGTLRDKVGSIVEYLSEMLFCANLELRKMRNKDNDFVEISMMIESYVMFKLYRKIFIGLTEIFEEEDSYIYRVIKFYRTGNYWDRFGIPKDLAGVSFQEASDKMANLRNCMTPIQMLFHIEDVVDTIMTLTETYSKANKLDLELTTDTLIPLIVYVLSQTDYHNFHTALFYMENFIFVDISANRNSFMLINVRGALQYLCDLTPEVPHPSSVPRGPRVTTIPLSSSARFNESVESVPVVPVSPSPAKTPSRQVKLVKPEMVQPFQRPPDVIEIDKPQGSGLDYLKSLEV
eukprot:TRINITY_DN12699_c0_g1_i1.p1 TRINITY_DN12699_c0_g1~~TRINITY_DN12699_c0_g1_i1.p1  ORF type:complete len:491 (-),score=53.01 TRINITY_DN12699_c0_g1_i1:2-1423(-)